MIWSLGLSEGLFSVLTTTLYPELLKCWPSGPRPIPLPNRSPLRRVKYYKWFVNRQTEKGKEQTPQKKEGKKEEKKGGRGRKERERK